MLIWIIVVLVVATAAYIRLAPSDPARWHTDISQMQDGTMMNGAVRTVEGDLAALDQIIRRGGSVVLAGSVDEGHITYISRTKLMSYPDYTTVQAADGKLRLFGRQRFGKSDLGVNAKRLERWLAQLG